MLARLLLISQSMKQVLLIHCRLPGCVQVTTDATMSRSKAAIPQSDPTPGFIPPGEPGLQPNHGK